MDIVREINTWQQLKGWSLPIQINWHIENVTFGVNDFHFCCDWSFDEILTEGSIEAIKDDICKLHDRLEVLMLSEQQTKKIREAFGKE